MEVLETVSTPPRLKTKFYNEDKDRKKSIVRLKKYTMLEYLNIPKNRKKFPRN